MYFSFLLTEVAKKKTFNGNGIAADLNKIAGDFS